MAKPGKSKHPVHRQGAGGASPLLMQAVGLHQSGQLDQAESLYRQILTRQPNDADALHYLGLIAFQRQRFLEAVELITQAVRLRPNVPGFHTNLGNAYKRLGQFDQAIAAYRKAVALDPNFVVAHFNLGAALLARGTPEQAIAPLRQALALQPRMAEAWLCLGEVALELDRIDEAEDHVRHALAERPDFPEALIVFGNLRQRFADGDQAQACYRRAMELGLNRADIHQRYLFWLNFQPIGPDEVFQAHLDWARRYADPLMPDERPAHSSHLRMRIGYLSPDFRQHALRWFIEPILRAHDRVRVEVFCYHDAAVNDAVTATLKTLPEHWVETRALSDEELVARIRADEIDVLVDLAGHTSNNRLLALARKPAPVQVSMLGYLNTTGMRAMDYRISDAVACPPAFDALHSERVVRLPHSQWCYQPDPAAPAPGPLPALARGYVTFASFHNVAKVNKAVIGLWADLLQVVPEARLQMVVWGDKAAGYIAEAFVDRGIDRERLLFRSPASYQNYLAMYREVDISLDVFPYAGGTTSCESLWMGVPYVSLAADSVPGRGGASVLTALDLGEWIAETPEQYVALARRLASDLDRLGALRAGLRARMEASPLLNAGEYTAALESIFSKILADN